MKTSPVAWTDGTWLHPPAAATAHGTDLLVTAVAGSDFWRTTSYGFVHQDGHGLLFPLARGQAVEVSFVADLPELYDQAGVLVHLDDANWVKAGIERSDGVPQLATVVTRDTSDWSVTPVPDWDGEQVTVRASLGADALTIRARCAGPWQLVRLAPFPAGGEVRAGPMVCAPSRAGLQVRFTRFAMGPADLSLHEPGI